MEDALAHNEEIHHDEHQEVLILVLMEDALALSKLTFEKDFCRVS